VEGWVEGSGEEEGEERAENFCGRSLGIGETRGWRETGTGVWGRGEEGRGSTLIVQLAF